MMGASLFPDGAKKLYDKVGKRPAASHARRQHEDG